MHHVIKYTDQNTTEIDPADIPEVVPLIPLRNAVVFPGVILPIFVGRSESIQLIEEFGKPGTMIGLFTQKNPEAENVSGDDLFPVGSLAEIHRILPMGEGGYQVFLQGVQKIRLEEVVTDEPFLKGKIAPIFEIKDDQPDTFLEFQTHVVRYIEYNPMIPDEVISFIKRITSASALANQVIFFSNRTIEEKVEFLGILSTAEKVTLVQQYLMEETRRLVMEKEVREKVEKDTSKMQRDFYLRKQLETIRKELGDSEESEADDLERQLETKPLPEYVRKAVQKELKRYRKLAESPQSGGLEVSQIRNWLELVAELPWAVTATELPASVANDAAALIVDAAGGASDSASDASQTSPPSPVAPIGSPVPVISDTAKPPMSTLNMERARQILNEDHEGLDEVKERILEHLAVERKAGATRAPILCLVGPPGVGKTSLAQSIARCLERNFLRAALGGVRDEAEIRGHRRTYVGALPGKILAAMRKCGTVDPVFLLDEVDKLGTSFQGDPSAALLEVLDPEQNNSFEDHYLGLPYDLSRTLFVCTANSLDAIPLPLLDRMEVVQLSGYTIEEKTAIAERHLIPRIQNDLHLSEAEFSLDRPALVRLIEEYTREAGVRNLKRKLEGLARKIILRMAENKTPPSPITKDGVRELLGRPRFIRDRKEFTGLPGVAVGLAWTPVGGDILFIESTAYAGKGTLKLSGSLGDVMKESAQAAFSFLRAHSAQLRLPDEVFSEKDFHIHIPGGAVPKDGPSAGVTLLTAMTSLLTGAPVVSDIAMTGEISLRGRILPVGGIKEKVLAARASGIDTVLLPERNRPDFEEIPDHIREGIKVEYFSDMMDLLRRTVPGAFTEGPGTRTAWSVRTRDGW